MPTFFSLKKLLSINYQRGQSTAYLVLIIMTIILAVMLTGGFDSLFTRNYPLSSSENPSGKGPDGTNPVTPTPVTTWQLVVNQKTCMQSPVAGKAIEILPEGPKDGYLVFEVEIVAKTYLATAFEKFTSPKQAFTYTLPNARSYNTKNWKIELYEGGQANADSTYSGGTLQKTVENNPTGCK